MGFIEEAKRIDEHLKERSGSQAGFKWRLLYYRALKYLTPQELDSMSFIDVFEVVGQRGRLEEERIQRLKDFIKRKTEAGSDPPWRPRLTDEQWQERFEKVRKVEGLKKAGLSGLPYEKICARLGIPYSSFKGWKRELKKRQRGKMGEDE
jgi:hypothetical protein